MSRACSLALWREPSRNDSGCNLTGYGSSSDEQRAIDASFDRHLTKPVSLTKLVEIVVETARDSAAAHAAQ